MSEPQRPRRARRGARAFDPPRASGLVGRLLVGRLLVGRLFVGLLLVGLASACVAGIPPPVPVSAEPYEEGQVPAAPSEEPGDYDASPLRCDGAVVARHPNYCFASAREACSYLECPSGKCDYAYSMPVQVSCIGGE